MASNSKIEWTDKSLNPGIYGCEKDSPACTNCYAMGMAWRQINMGNYPAGIVDDKRQWTGKVIVDFDRIAPAFAKLPKKKPCRVFLTSMADLFHKDVPYEFIDEVFRYMDARPHLTFLVLSKRAERMGGYRMPGSTTWPSNVWAGTTVENQKRADERIPHLLQVPAKRFLSMEPLLGPVDLSRVKEFLNPMWQWGHNGRTRGRHFCDDRCECPIQWIISGGESGPRARPSHPDWFRSIRDQCKAAGVPYFHKQNGQWIERRPGDGLGSYNSDDRGQYIVGQDGTCHNFRTTAPAGAVAMQRMSKKAAGAKLDGVEHRELPAGWSS